MLKKIWNNIKTLPRRLPIFWKILFFYLLLLSSFTGTAFYFSSDLVQNLALVVPLNDKAIYIIRDFLIEIVGFSLLIGFFIALLLFIDLKQFLRELNRILKDALVERKLESSFDDFYKGKTFFRVINNTESLFGLFKSFDNMKTSRITLEFNTLKVLLNNLSEGIILVNKEKVVTHISHTGETMLRLIPGEIVGQNIYRKISHTTFLENFEEALESEKKIIGQTVEIKEGHPLDLNVFPVKNKFGEVMRVVIILKESQAEAKGDTKARSKGK